MAKFPTRGQVSAGGVAFRRNNGQIEVVLISVDVPPRWQLPKGLVGKDEARWVAIDQAADMLTFANERKDVYKARDMIAALDK